jgi:transposase
VIIKENLNNSDAFNLEVKTIALIGRRDLKNGPLTNLTEGGEGAVDFSDQTRHKISVSAKKRGILATTIEAGAAARRGIPLKQSHKDKLSISHKGKNTGSKKLSLEDVISIKKMRSGGSSYEDIASLFEVSFDTISKICRGLRSYAPQVGADVSSIKRSKRRSKINKRLIVDDLVKIKEMRKTMSCPKIAVRYGVSPETIRRICLGVTQYARI